MPLETNGSEIEFTAFNILNLITVGTFVWDADDKANEITIIIHVRNIAARKIAFVEMGVCADALLSLSALR